MGTTILDAGTNTPKLHLYAHCLRDHQGGIALVALNLDQANATTVNLNAAAEQYTLTSDSSLGDSDSLNGHRLMLPSLDRLPAIAPVKASKGTLVLPPASITFMPISKSDSAACRK